jgi:hypothetical protein
LDPNAKALKNFPNILVQHTLFLKLAESFPNIFCAAHAFLEAG